MPDKAKTCRNCGSEELYSKKVHSGGFYGPNLLPLGMLASPMFRVEVCTDCGLVEWFVPGVADRKKIRKLFKRSN